MEMNAMKKDEGGFFKSFLPIYKKALIYAFGFSFAINLLTLGLPVYSLQVFDRVLSTGSMETLFVLTLVMVTALLCLSGLSYIRSMVFSDIGQHLDRNASKQILSFSLTHRGQVKSSQLLRDLTQIKSFITGSMLTTLLDAPWCILYIIAIFLIHKVTGFITLGGALFLLTMAILNERSTKKNLQHSNETQLKNLQRVEAMTLSQDAIDALGMKERMVRSWSKSHEFVLNSQQNAVHATHSIGSITKFFRLMLQILITGVGGYLVIQGELSSGGLIAGSILSGKALAPFDAAINIWNQVTGCLGAYKRIESVMDVQSTKKTETLSLPKPKGHLSVEKIVFAHPGSESPVIKNVNFQVLPGQIVAILGPSGSGKTTLARLMMGILKPASGVVRLDSADVCQWNREEFGRYVGYLPQNMELFSGTVRENVSRMNEEASSDSVLQAAQFTDTHDLILRFPQGYETEIGHNGLLLSTGQRQRVALARAFYGNPAFVVLDEPNSNLDHEGEQALIETLKRAKEKKITTLIISHRTSIIKVVDKMLILKEGVVEKYGNREEIIRALTTTKNLVPVQN